MGADRSYPQMGADKEGCPQMTQMNADEERILCSGPS